MCSCSVLENGSLYSVHKGFFSAYHIYHICTLIVTFSSNPYCSHTLTPGLLWFWLCWWTLGKSQFSSILLHPSFCLYLPIVPRQWHPMRLAKVLAQSVQLKNLCSVELYSACILLQFSFSPALDVDLWINISILILKNKFPLLLLHYIFLFRLFPDNRMCVSSWLGWPQRFCVPWTLKRTSLQASKHAERTSRNIYTVYLSSVPS